MKSINFINPVPPQKQKELTYWFYGSVAMLCVWVALLGVIYYQNALHYRLVQQEAHELLETTSQQKSLVTKKENLLKVKDALDHQLKVMTHQRQMASAPFQLLADLARIIPQSCCLTSLQAHISGQCTITGLARDTKAVATFIDLLNSCVHLDDPRLVTLTPNPHKESAFSIAGTWKPTEQAHDSVLSSFHA